MWSPTDKNALPSREDMLHAKEAISTLENTLKDAYELVKSTKVRIIEIERELVQRKGWIAPIRKVPPEVLVDVLLWASEMDDLAPVKLTTVCRLWRRLILATPKAWSFINLIPQYERHAYFRNYHSDHRYFPGYTSTYFERSRPRLLHLGLPNTEGLYPKHSNSIILQQSHRIQCLTTNTDVLSFTQSSNRCQQFPYLQTLVITNSEGGTKLDAAFFNISRFPALQTLRWPRCYPLYTASPAISPSSFPPLQHLSLNIEALPFYMDILEGCAKTLRTLEIKTILGRNTAPIPPRTITFPLLRCLHLFNPTYDEECPLLVKASTPILTSLIVWQIPKYFEADFQKITHLRTSWPRIPSVCDQVQVLQVGIPLGVNDSGLLAWAEALGELANAHPTLETIEFSSEGRGHGSVRKLQKNVEGCFGEGDIKPKLLFTAQWNTNLPGYEADNCGEDMPCYLP